MKRQHTCQPSPVPGLQLLLHHLLAFPCCSHQNASSLSFLSACPASKASSQSNQTLMPLHWTAPGGLYLKVTHQSSDCGYSSDYCTASKGRCHCSDDRCARPILGCTPRHICSSKTQQCCRRSDCRRRACSHTR